VAQDGAYARDGSQSLGIGGSAAADHDHLRASVGSHASNGLAAFARGGTGDCASVDDSPVSGFAIFGATQAQRVEQLADDLRLVLVDFTAQRDLPIFGDHKRGF